MKKPVILVFAMAVLPFVAASSAFAASWTDQIQNAIKSGDFAQIDVIAAKNPQDQGDIAIYLLQQSQNKALSQNVRIELFESAAPFGSQIPPEDAGQAAELISEMLGISGEPGFQKDHHKEAAGVIAAALGLSDQPNILTSDPKVHELALAQAGDFPDQDDKGLKDQVDLALQIGLSPPVGPRGIINPSAE